MKAKPKVFHKYPYKLLDLNPFLKSLTFKIGLRRSFLLSVNRIFYLGSFSACDKFKYILLISSII